MSDPLRGFSGFSAGKTRFTCLPNAFYTEILPIVDDLAELKAILYAFWRLDQAHGDIRYIRLNDVLVDLLFLESFAASASERETRVRSAFARAAQRGVLLEIKVLNDDSEEWLYFLNSTKGRGAIDRIRRGEIGDLSLDLDDTVLDLARDRPNIYLLYEQNIGMITPMISEKLRQAERDYPEDWIGDAFNEAITNDKRNWAYISRVLQSWAEHGKERSNQTR